MWKQLNWLFSKSAQDIKVLRAEKFGNINLYQ